MINVEKVRTNVISCDNIHGGVSGDVTVV